MSSNSLVLLCALPDLESLPEKGDVTASAANYIVYWPSGERVAPDCKSWTRDKQLPVLAKFGYDMRKVLLDGTPADRAALNKSAPAIRDHYARTLAYEQQVCGLGS